jgi:hypothetical protein
MSKKNKFKKRAGSAETTGNPSVKETAVTSTPKSSGETFTLIRFDRRTKIFLLLLFSVYIILGFSKIHTSNIANWDMFFGKQQSEAVLAGKPRFIRMDEWMISSTAVMGQYEAGLPLKNEANGGGNAPVVFGLPIKDISAVLRPSTWPYFIFDLERAFAFSWNFNLFFFLVSMFLVFMLLTKNNFWLSAAGAFFIFLVPGIQWWSYLISTEMMCLNGMFLSFIYLLYSSKRSTLIISSLVLITSIFSFVSFLYPPFQVPLVYLYGALLIGYFIREKNFSLMKKGLNQKIMIGGLAFVFLAFILFHFYQIAADSFAMMLNTVYPGRRFDTGGDLIAGKLFADFFSPFMSDTHTPQKWLNICEASGAIMFFPVVFYTIGYFYFRYKKTDSLLITVSLFVIIGLLYVIAGFPAALSKISLFSMSPAYRTLPVVAIGNCVLLICFLGSKKLEWKKDNFSWMECGVLAAATVVFMLAVTSGISKATENFFTGQQVTMAIVMITAAYLLARYKDLRFAKSALYTLLLAMVINNAGANPLTKGLGPVLDNPLTVASREIHKKDPVAGWALFGNVRLTHLIKANGINVLNGVKYVPAIDQMQVLDPQKLKDSVYNRYAWVTMTSFIDGNDGVNFVQEFNDAYTIQMDPCSPKLKQLNVKYIVFDYKPQESETRCLTKLTETTGISIYKRNDQ